MKHPIIKLFLARLRAVAAAERVAYPVISLPAMLTPFVRHTIRIELQEGGALIVTDAGEAAANLFGRAIVGQPLSGLFQLSDRPKIDAMMAAAMSERIGCVFGAEARHSRFRMTAIEAMLTPEPAEEGAPLRVSACLVPFGFPRRRRGRPPLPPLSIISERFVDLDGFAGGTRDFRSPPYRLRRG